MLPALPNSGSPVHAVPNKNSTSTEQIEYQEISLERCVLDTLCLFFRSKVSSSNDTSQDNRNRTET